MYSFEGNFRSKPQVSLGGRSKEVKLSKASLLQKAHLERLKRENARRELRSSVIIQSSVRSFLVRKKLKQDFRDLFDYDKEKAFDVEQAQKAMRRLCFFYDGVGDTERLVWLCQNLLRHPENFQNPNSIHLFSQILVLCCRVLLDGSQSTTAIPLRMLETHVSKFSAEGVSEVKNYKYASYLWQRLLKHEYFPCMLHIFEKKVPLDLDPPSSASLRNPQMQLASSLLNILKQPLMFLDQLLRFGQTQAAMVLAEEEKMLHSETVKLIFHHFCKDILATKMTHQIYNYILPELSKLPLLLHEELALHLEKHLATGDEQDIPRNLNLLSAFFVLVKPNFDSLSCKPSLLAILGCLVSTISRYSGAHIGISAPDSSDEEDDASMDVDGSGHELHFSERQSIASSVLASDCIEFLVSSKFINSFAKTDLHNPSVITVFCEISFHFLSSMRIAVHTNRLLYTLAFSPVFLKHLWKSIVGLRAQTRNSMIGSSSIRALLDGRCTTMTEASMHDLVIRLVTFSSLFSHNLLSLHDVDFYATGSASNRRNAFELSEIATISTTLRDVCLSLVKIVLPETRSRFSDYDVREVYQCLSSGKLLRHIPSVRNDGKILSTATAVLCFKVCSRLVIQLHTRHTRRSFAPDSIWLSSAIIIGNDRSKFLSSNWRKRKLRNDNIAAHMADPSDEDLPITTTEARQLAVLTTLPFVVSFQTRVSIFTTMLSQDRESRESNRDVLLHDAGFSDTSTVIRVTVRRDFLYEDAFNDLSETNAPDLRRVLRVSFVNQAGATEAGYGEGVTREFLQQIVRSAFNPTRGLFVAADDASLYPNPYASKLFDNYEQHFQFLGRLLGKILYEGMQVELPFAAFFLCKLLRHKNSDVDINHLQSLDPDFYKNLMSIRTTDDVSQLHLDFTVVDDRFGETSVTELIPNGQNIAVTNENRVRYIHLLANYKLNVQMREACDAFRTGLASVIPIEWLRMFDHREFQTLLSGAEAPISVEDMKQNAVYSGGYNAEHPTVQLLWVVLSEFSEEEKRKLLRFVTSCSRPPLLGFKEMHPPFCVHNGGEADRLPTSSTCLNLMRLPQYDTAELMKEKLLYCLNSESGFELS